MSNSNPEEIFELLKLGIVTVVLFAALRYGIIPALSGSLASLTDFITVMVLAFVALVFLDMIKEGLR